MKMGHSGANKAFLTFNNGSKFFLLFKRNFIILITNLKTIAIYFKKKRDSG